MGLIPEFFPDCVVAIGADGEGERSWIASGFLYGYLVEKDGLKGYHVYLVTNRHVLEELSTVYVRFNPQADEEAAEYELELTGENIAANWVAHPDPEIDIAVVPTDFDVLRERALKVAFFRNDQTVATIEKMNEIGVTEGDFAYVLGFPMGIVGERRNAVIIRAGSIARIRDTLARANREFLIDAFVFPGNSGGPVVLKPEGMAIHGTKSNSRAYLIGVVQSYVPYEEVAVSAQTGRTRIVFEENSGLAAAHPVDFIDETIQEHLKKIIPNGQRQAKMKT